LADCLGLELPNLKHEVPAEQSFEMNRIQREAQAHHFACQAALFAVILRVGQAQSPL